MIVRMHLYMNIFNSLKNILFPLKMQYIYTQIAYRNNLDGLPLIMMFFLFKILNDLKMNKINSII